MSKRLQQYTADHRYLLEVVARQAGFRAPVAIDLDEFYEPLLRAARKGEILPFDGVLVRDWDPDNRRSCPGLGLGLRFYHIEGIRFVCVAFNFADDEKQAGFYFAAVDRKDYRRLYRIALRCRRDAEPPSSPPILPAEQADLLWKNTIGYLEPANLRRIKRYGGRARRGLLLTGAPGNGKTMACRWVWEECRRRRWEWKLVTPAAYSQARASDGAVEGIRSLFTVERRGIVFFDDMDQALRDRETVKETDDQATFLTALDGISVNEGVVFVFTTNCALDLIDRAFKRPGRLDLVLHFKTPDALLRRRLMERWHDEIQSHLNLDTAVASTDGFSFAEIEELKNLLVMNFLDTGQWNWGWALKQFDINRSQLAAREHRQAGFHAIGSLGKGNGNRNAEEH
jgi:cell division protease FtsH